MSTYETEKEKASYHEDASPARVEQAFQHDDFDPVEHRRILRKIDWHLLPFVSLLYLLSFLDRSNIGNAKVAGMAVDAHLDGLKYNTVAAVFFIPYALAEVPSNILLKLARPSRWIPSIMVAWGIVMTLMCLCDNYHDLIIARIFLGLTEAGLFPGVTFYLSLWYRRREVSSRIAIFFSAATVAGAFGGILAFGIEKMEGIAGLHGWQWIFCLEGILTVICAVASYFFMHDYPETATFLTADERAHVVKILRADAKGLATHYDFKFVLQALFDYKSWVQVGVYMGNLITVYAISLFLPTIIAELGYANAEAQLLTIPPFVLGATIIVGFVSDRMNLRGPFIIGGSFVAIIGYIVLYTQSKPGPSYVGTFLAAAGVFPTIAVNLAWAGSMAGGDIRKGVVIAMVIGIGNLGGICSSFIYITPPRFHIGHGTILGWLGLSILCTAFAMWDYRRLNRAKEARCKAEGIEESRWEEFVEMGSESPLFRYTL
ncbi:MFS general substrate transporter [Schizophyllum commune Tattone D]|nr:MFS general substrate transporter [Schizophyllum commune Tattone D]